MRHEENEVRQIYQDYGDDLYRLCYFYTGNSYDAMDAVQNTLIRLMEYGGNFESERHKKSWLLKVGVNECRQIHRQWWRRKVTFDETLTDSEAESTMAGEHLYQDGQGEPVHGSGQAEDRIKDVWESVMSLPAKYRIPIYMHYYAGYSAEEIAHILGKRASTVRSWMMRARKQLKEDLTG